MARATKLKDRRPVLSQASLSSPPDDWGRTGKLKNENKPRAQTPVKAGALMNAVKRDDFLYLSFYF